MDESADESVVIDILHMAPGNTLEEVGRAHWNTILRLNQAQSSQLGELMITTPQDALPSLVLPPTLTKEPGTLLLMGNMSAPKFNEAALNSVDVYMCLLRLEQQEADVLIVLYSPVVVNPESSSAKSFEGVNPDGALALFKSITASFNILDWGLFP